MKESIEGCIELPDVSSDILEIYIYWIYNRVIVLPDGSDSENLHSGNLLTFVDLYVFADLYDTRELRNDIVKATLECTSSDMLDYEVVGQALHKLPQKSKLYALLLMDMQSPGGLDLTDEYSCEQLSMHFPREAIRVLIYAHTSGTRKNRDDQPEERWLESDPEK